MNPAKAAPSAPVKKAVREDPQILPGGLLILFFFFYLRWVRQFSAITTSTSKPMTSRIPVILMPPPGSHPTSGFGARHSLPKFFRHKKRRIVQNDAADWWT